MPLSHVIVNFPFAGIHGNVDDYNFFKFEPIHNPCLGIGRLLKECLWILLRDGAKKTSMLQSTCGISKSFKAVKSAVHSVLNRFLAYTQQRSMGPGLQKNFKGPGKKGQLNGLFTETGLKRLI